MAEISEADYEVTADVFNQKISVFGLKAGEVLLCRPTKPLSEHQSQALDRQLRTMTEGSGIKILVVPSTWDLAVARPVEEERLYENLRGLIEATR